ncbi:MAG: hypothetical protein J6S95_07265, partial [Lachnospiraceae bacterium]|nr:hypothetical protein [Lachnospiraceae bacterium]
MAWLLLYLSAEYAVSPTKKWVFITNQLSLGCTSPVMYVEAANMLLLNSALLADLNTVELRILSYMVKEHLLTNEVARQVVYLAGSGKWYTNSLIEILKSCYDVLQSVDALTVLCTLLIAHDKKGPEYFQWYKLALEEEARVTKIYEYYMMSIDTVRVNELPKMVYLYFSYQNELDWKLTAYLYARVIENREQLEDIFPTYKEQIDRFTINQIAEGHMNKDLAIIYRFVLSENVISKDMAVKLAKLIFTHRISISSDLPQRVIVYQSREVVGTSYPIVGHEAFVPIYNKDFDIMFEDNFSNRYMKSVDYDIEKLIVPGKLANMLLPHVDDNLSFDVYACECSSEMVEIDDENRIRYQRILDAPEIDTAYKAEIRSKIMQYYYDNDRIRELDLLLESLNAEEMNAKERNTCVKYMIMRGMYDKALEWIFDFGIEGVDLRDLVKLCSNLIVRGDFEPSDDITDISAFCFFKNKYDETILKYLCDNYNGMTKDLRKLFTAAENFDIDVHGMCEKLIVQMLFTGYFVSERMDIYKKYISTGANQNIRMAFLTQCSYDYFVKEQLMEAAVFEEIAKVKAMGERIGDVSKLAYVKFYSEEKNLIDKEVMDNITEFINDLLEKGIYMSFFKEFVEKGSTGVDRYSDKTIIEYKSEPGARVYIHYIIEGDEDIRAEYVTEEMREMFGGVFAKSFILFFGENLQYYVTEEREGEELLTESGSVQKSDISNEATDSKFNRI